MAKGPIITSKTRRIIAQVYLEHPDYRAKEVETEVKYLLGGEGPGTSAVQKELTKIRRSRLEISDVPERKWSLGSLSEQEMFDVTADSIPTLLKVQVNRIENQEPPLTVREAKWVARLHSLTADIDELSNWAKLYSIQEQACIISGTPFDTTELDLSLIYGVTGLSFIGWMASTDTIEDSSKIEAGRCIAHSLEEKLFGQTLKGLDLTGKGWWWYALELSLCLANPEWNELPIEQRKTIAQRLQEYVDQSQGEFIHAGKIFEEFKLRPTEEKKL